MKSEISRAPQIHVLREIDVQYWEEDIARNRADKNRYAYAKDIKNYYAELKGVEDEKKLALEREGSGYVEGAWNDMIKSGAGGDECKDAMELRTTKSDGAVDKK